MVASRKAFSGAKKVIPIGASALKNITILFILPERYFQRYFQFVMVIQDKFGDILVTVEDPPVRILLTTIPALKPYYLITALTIFTSNLNFSSSASFSIPDNISLNSLELLASWANSKKSFTSTFKALASLSRVSMDGKCCPISTLLRYLELISVFSASSS